MKVLFYQVASSQSAQKKHYAIALTETGQLFTHYGSGYFANNKYFTTRGTYSEPKISLNEVNNMGRLVNRMKTIAKSKHDKSDYDTTVDEFVVYDVPLTAIEISQSYKKLFEAIYRQQTTGYKPKHKSWFHTNFSEASNFAMSHDITKVNKAGLPVSSPKPVMKKEKVETFFTQVDPKIVRPNGEQYHPREILGHTDVALLKEFRKKNLYVRLAGSPGAGKTALVEGSFDDLITVSGHGDMTVAHFVGTYLPDNAGGWKWQDGPLVRAMREGKVLFVDEGTRIPTEVLNILFSVMDGRNILRLDDRPDLPIVTGKKGFYVIMGYNPNTLGARPLDEALVSRFRVQIDVHTDYNTAKKMGVPALAIKIARNLETQNIQDKANEGPGVWVPQMRELITYRDLIKIGTGEDFALSTLLASCPREIDVPKVREAIKNATNKQLTVPTLGGII